MSHLVVAIPLRLQEATDPCSWTMSCAPAFGSLEDGPTSRVRSSRNRMLSVAASEKSVAR